MNPRTKGQRKLPLLPATVDQGKLILGKTIVPKTNPIGFGASSPVEGEAQWVLDPSDEGHTMVIGPTGSGKGVSSLIPTVLTYPGPLICVDVKGEITKVAARRRREMGQAVHVLDPFHLISSAPATFNPFDLLKARDAGFVLEDLVFLCANSLGFGELSMAKEPFWDNKAREVLAAVIAIVLATEPAESCHWLTVRDLFMQDDPVYGLAKLLDDKGKTLPPVAYRTVANFLSTEDKCRSGILATATQYFGFSWHPGIEESLRRTSFDLDAIRSGHPVSIFLVIPPTRLLSHGRVLRLWIESLLQLMLTRTQRPKLPTMLMLDEAAQMGTLDSLRTALTLMRGYGVRTVTYWQDFSQLQKLYPDYPTLLNNCANLLLLGANTWLAGQSLAQLTGTSFSAEDILALSKEEAILVQGGSSQKVEKLNYLCDPAFAGVADANPFYQGVVGGLSEASMPELLLTLEKTAVSASAPKVHTRSN